MNGELEKIKEYEAQLAAKKALKKIYDAQIKKGRILTDEETQKHLALCDEIKLLKDKIKELKSHKANDNQDNEEAETEKKQKRIQAALIGLACLTSMGIGIVATKISSESKNNSEKISDDTKTTEEPVATIAPTDAYNYEENTYVAPETEVINTPEPTEAPISTPDVTVTPEPTEAPIQTPDVTVTPEPTEAPIPTPSDPFMNVPNYVEIYRSEYEELRTLYNITYVDVVDYVNRAHSIQTFNFFPEASIDDVVRLLMNIDNKKLFTQDDDGLTSILVTVIGQVAENAVWRQPMEEDINKMNALQYFAKDDTDLDKFLTELGEINKKVLSDPNNNEEKHNAYLYLRTFIHSFNSYDNMINYINEYPETDYGQELANDLANGEILTDETLKEKASVKDSYDWYFSYNLASAFASIYAPIDYNEEEFAKWDELWMMGQTALESPQIQAICNDSLGLTLGGE